MSNNGGLSYTTTICHTHHLFSHNYAFNSIMSNVNGDDDISRLKASVALSIITFSFLVRDRTANCM